MAVTAAPHGRVPGYVDVEQVKTTGRFRQAWNLISLFFTTQACGTRLTRINQEEQRIHYYGPCSGAPVRPIQSSVDRYEAVRRQLSGID